jgi:predicted Rossmann fold flavoprotein
LTYYRQNGIEHDRQAGIYHRRWSSARARGKDRVGTVTLSQRLADNSQNYDVVVLGAGAAGLMCALTAGQRGRRVLVLEKSNKVGKKILMSGGGRCNFTNLEVEPENFISANPHFCKSALSRYTQWDFIAMVEKHGVEYEERKHGQLFCLNTARDILDMLLAECETAAVEIRSGCEIVDIQTLSSTDEKPGYALTLSKDSEEDRGMTLTCPAVVVATGALSIPTLGGSVRREIRPVTDGSSRRLGALHV